jgi:quinol monooxygenase YgiN
MALVPAATKGNYFHVYDFRVKPGRGDEFVELFNKFDYGDNNPFHRSVAQVKDGVLCYDAADPDHFCLIGEWADIEEHRRHSRVRYARDQAGICPADRGRNRPSSPREGGREMDGSRVG